MTPLRSFLLAIALTSASTSLAVTEVAPDPANKGNWNREELLAYLQRSWDAGDMAALHEWFDSDAEWKPIWVKIVFWRQPDSEFKRKVVVMMLKGSAMAWDDPLPAGGAFESQVSAERESTIEGCLEAIRAAAPALPVGRADFESAPSRIALANRFAASIAGNRPPASAADREDSADEVDAAPAVTRASISHSKFFGIPVPWLSTAVGAVLAAGYFGRRLRFHRKACP